MTLISEEATYKQSWPGNYTGCDFIAPLVSRYCILKISQLRYQHILFVRGFDQSVGIKIYSLGPNNRYSPGPTLRVTSKSNSKKNFLTVYI